MRAYVSQLICHFGRIWRICIGLFCAKRFLGLSVPSSMGPSVPRRMFFLSAVNTQIQGLQSNLLKAQTDLASQIASEVQPETYVFKKKGNEQQFNFNRKVIKRSSAAVR